MNPICPSTEDVRARLLALKDGEIERIAGDSGVPASTLWKIRIGATKNPGVETVRKFFHLLPTAPCSTTADPQTTQHGAAHA
jgi:predicted transcriptional regulator